MATVTHPFTNDKPTLVEEYYGVGVWHFHTERSARYRRAGSQYKVRELFATVRPNFNGAGMLDSTGQGMVVLRNNFDEIREFPDFDAAKTYIHALFALEHAAG